MRTAFILISFTLCSVVWAVPLPKSNKPKDPTRAQIEDLQGDWKIVSHKQEGTELKGPFSEIYRFKQNELTIYSDIQVRGRYQLVLDTKHKPVSVNLVHEELSEKNPMLGILEQVDDTLKLCYIADGKARPTDFSSSGQNGATFIVFNRVKK
jgi:uncharacterized protein (TIGR03067 family)